MRLEEAKLADILYHSIAHVVWVKDCFLFYQVYSTLRIRGCFPRYFYLSNIVCHAQAAENLVSYGDTSVLLVSIYFS